MARQVGRLKLGSKPAKLYVKLNIIPLSQLANHVSTGIIRHFVCLHFCLTGYQSAQFIWRDFALCKCQSAPFLHIYVHISSIYIYIYIYIYIIYFYVYIYIHKYFAYIYIYDTGLIIYSFLFCLTILYPRQKTAQSTLYSIALGSHIFYPHPQRQTNEKSSAITYPHHNIPTLNPLPQSDCPAINI